MIFIANVEDNPNEKIDFAKLIYNNFKSKFEFINKTSRKIIEERKKKTFKIDLPVLINFPFFLKTS